MGLFDWIGGQTPAGPPRLDLEEPGGQTPTPYHQPGVAIRERDLGTLSQPRATWADWDKAFGPIAEDGIKDPNDFTARDSISGLSSVLKGLGAVGDQYTQMPVARNIGQGIPRVGPTTHAGDKAIIALLRGRKYF